MVKSFNRQVGPSNLVHNLLNMFHDAAYVMNFVVIWLQLNCASQALTVSHGTPVDD